VADLTPRDAAPEDPDGFGLKCGTCDHLFPPDVTMAVAGAHMKIEHGVDEIAFELAVLCPRCHKAMAVGRQETLANGVVKSWWDCPKCHRTRVVRQSPEANHG
jgi:hypothetical protein